jgi:hypothetical protein
MATSLKMGVNINRQGAWNRRFAGENGMKYPVSPLLFALTVIFPVNF